MSDVDDLTTLDGRLRAAWRAAGNANAAQAAIKAGVPYSTFAGHSNGNAGIPANALTRYARVFRVSLDWLMTGKGQMQRDQGAIVGEQVMKGLEVAGKVQAGSWLDITAIDDDYEPRRIPVLPLVGYFQARQYALEVVGDSMSEIVDDGDFVTCVDFAESGLALRKGMIVHVERHRDAGQLVETTLKEVDRRSGRWWLVPRSTNPKWQPFLLSDDDEVVVKGVVTGAYHPIAF